MHKFTKFLLILIVVLLIIYFWVSNFSTDLKHDSIQDKVGARIMTGGIELSMNEYYTLAQCFETYREYILKKDYKTAYSMLGIGYREYMPYEEYENKVKDLTYEDLILKDINVITNTTFDVLSGASGDEEHYSILINEENNTFAIYPYSFLEYNNEEISFSKSKITCILKNYTVNIDECIFNFEITNNNKEAMSISNSILTLNNNKEVNNADPIEIKQGETKQVTIKFDTDYNFPQKIVLENNIKKIEFLFN